MAKKICVCVMLLQSYVKVLRLSFFKCYFLFIVMIFVIFAVSFTDLR